MKQTAVEWLAEKYNEVNWLRNRDEISSKYADELREGFLKQAKEMEKQQQGYSEEEFKEMVYHMVGQLAQANNMTFNGAILDELFNKFKNK